MIIFSFTNLARAALHKLKGNCPQLYRWYNWRFHSNNSSLGYLQIPVTTHKGQPDLYLTKRYSQYINSHIFCLFHCESFCIYHTNELKEFTKVLRNLVCRKGGQIGAVKSLYGYRVPFNCFSSMDILSNSQICSCK